MNSGRYVLSQVLDLMGEHRAKFVAAKLDTITAEIGPMDKRIQEIDKELAVIRGRLNQRVIT